jgi:hypothetical protein
VKSADESELNKNLLHANAWETRQKTGKQKLIPFNL